MQQPKFVFVLMKFFPLHKTHSNWIIDVVKPPFLPSSLFFRHIPFGPITQSRSCALAFEAGKFMAILLGAVAKEERGAKAGDKIYAASDAIELQWKRKRQWNAFYSCRRVCRGARRERGSVEDSDSRRQRRRQRKGRRVCGQCSRLVWLPEKCNFNLPFYRFCQQVWWA